MRRVELYLRDIIEAANNIAQDIEGCGREDFLANRMLRDAVVRNLTVVAEAGGHVSQTLRERYPDVPWADIVAFRNILVHAYFGLDWDIVWHAASQQVSELADSVARIVKHEFPEAAG